MRIAARKMSEIISARADMHELTENTWVSRQSKGLLFCRCPFFQQTSILKDRLAVSRLKVYQYGWVTRVIQQTRVKNWLRYSDHPASKFYIDEKLRNLASIFDTSRLW